jgi:hypothetical protein
MSEKSKEKNTINPNKTQPRPKQEREKWGYEIPGFWFTGPGGGQTFIQIGPEENK